MVFHALDLCQGPDPQTMLREVPRLCPALVLYQQRGHNMTQQRMNMFNEYDVQRRSHVPEVVTCCD